VYWLGFSGPLGGDHAEAVRAVLIGVGVLTALLGALMAFLQSSLKRMLAFVVVSHVGVFLCGIALLTAHGLAGATVYLVADGLVKGALFCAIGYLGRSVGHADELEAHGQCRGMNAAAALFALAAVGVAAVPPFGTFLARALESQALPHDAWEWLPAVLMVATATTGAAVLRATARIFFAIGPARDELLERAPAGEREEEPGRGGVLLWVPAVPLLAGGLVLAFVPGIAARAIEHAERAVDRAASARELLHAASSPPLQAAHFHVTAGSYAYGGAGALLAIALAWLSLGPLARRSGGAPIRRLKLVHDGVVADYVTWLIVGSAALTGVLAALIH
jgi:multicomponent Na+:H+ antiporter subunit D